MPIKAWSWAISSVASVNSYQNGFMHKRRILLLGLDGFDVDLAERFMREGLLPNFARLQAEGACFDLDHGRDKYSGLSWEHFSSGIRPSDGGRWSAVNFDKRTYQATQDLTRVRPFLADLASQKLSSLTCPISTSLLPRMFAASPLGERHDPGVAPASRPVGLHQEMADSSGNIQLRNGSMDFAGPRHGRPGPLARLSRRPRSCVRALRAGCSRSVCPIGISV